MSVPTATSLAARVEDLSSAAVRSGASAVAIARLLESVSVATMHAVALDLLYVKRVPAEEPAPAATVLRAAA
jgi:hypothetical protein